MTPWSQRPVEERALLNPSFCSLLLWQAANGWGATVNTGLPLEVAFLILPLVLHGGTREALPATISTSLAAWLNEHPLLRARFSERARVLATFSREALMFGGLHGLLAFENNSLRAHPNHRRAINTVLKTSTDEVRACAKKAEFAGKWLARAGTPSTIMALLGVKP